MSAAVPDALLPIPKEQYSAKRSKDCSELVEIIPPRSFEELSEILLSERPAPSPLIGTVSLIVERPCINGRNIISETNLSPHVGMENSGWEERANIGYNDQLCIMSTTAIRAITGGDDHDAWAAAGDQMFLDFDMGPRIQTGDEIRLGEAVVVVSPKEHTGCSKFKARYGDGALKVVSNKLGRERRLRGMYFIVKEGGVVRTGDRVEKIESASSSSSNCVLM